MSEETIGTARIDIVVDTSQFEAAVSRGKTLTSQMGESGEAAYQKLNAGAKRATTSLLQWAENLGRTAEEQKLLNAAMRGVPLEALEAARQKILQQRAAAAALAQAHEEAAAAAKKLAEQEAAAKETAIFEQRLADARKLQEASSYIRFWNEQLDLMEAKEAEAKNAALFDQRLAEARKLREASSYISFWNEQLDLMEAKEAAANDLVLFQRQASDAAKLREAASYVQFWNEQLDQMEATERHLAAQSTFLSSLENQATALGKTRAELLELKAAELGVSEQAAPFIARLKESEAAVLGAGMSVKQSAAMMRLLPAQITDITVGLATGQSPFYILLQQGGQLKDMFGGIGPAVKQVGTYVLGLVNPYTIAAAAAGALLFAWKEGSDETVAYNKALATTGDYAGVTTGRLSDLAKAISASVGTQHEAAAALAEVTASGKFTGDQLALVARASLDASRINGQATAETIRQFSDLKEKPVEAVLKLNDAQHFLTLATYERIKALENEGKSQEAATLAMKTYSQALDERRAEVVNNAGLMERAWDSVASHAKGAWDAMLDVGRERSLMDQVEDINRKIHELSTPRVDRAGNLVQGANGEQIRQLEQQRSDLILKIMADGKAARDKAAAAQLAQDKADSDREVQEFATNAQKRATELAQKQGEYNARIARALAAGNKKLADELRASEKLVLAGITEKYKDPKQPKSPEVSAYATFKGQVDALDVKTITADNAALTAYQQGVRKLADEMADYMAKGGDATKAAELFNRGQQALYQTLQRTRQQETDAEKQYAAALEKTNQALALQVNNEVARIGMGEKEYQRTQEIAQAYRDQADALAELALKRQMGIDGKSGGISQDQYTADVEALRAATDEKVRIMQDGYARMDAAQGDWVNGARKAYQDWIDQASDVAGQTDSFATSTFDRLADGIDGAMERGKFSVKDFIKSSLSDFAKMEARLATMKLLQMVLGAFLGGNRTMGAGDSLNGGANYTGNGSLSTSWPGMSGGGWSTHAKGGVYSSPSLSAYSNGVYNSPQVFAFAKGAGVFAEAGPEAIMPLRRGPDGRLGVAAAGVGGMGDVIVNLNVQQSGDGSVSADGDVLAASQLGKQLGDQMKITAQRVLQDAMRPGGMLYKSRNGVGAAA